MENQQRLIDEENGILIYNNIPCLIFSKIQSEKGSVSCIDYEIYYNGTKCILENYDYIVYDIRNYSREEYIKNLQKNNWKVVVETYDFYTK